MRRGVRVHAPERIERDRQRQEEVHLPVEEIIGVAREHRARLLPRVAQLVAPLAQRHVVAGHHHSEQQPVRHLHAGKQAAVHHPQHEAQRHDRHIDDRDVLEAQQAVGEVGRQIQQQRPEADGGRARQQRQREAERHARRGQQHRLRRGDLATGDGTAALCRVQPVLRGVVHVVERIDRRGGQAHRHKAQQRHAGRQNPPAKKRRHEHQHVLEHMPRPHQHPKRVCALSSLPHSCLHG